MKKILISQTTTDSNILHELATDKDSDVRWYVARNSNTSPETLRLLSTDEYYYVYYEVAQNKNCPSDVYKYIQGRRIIETGNFS